MDADGIAEFVATARAEYEAQLTEFGGYARAEAARKAEADHARLFPGGCSVPGLHLFVAEESGVPIGRVVLAEQAVGGAESTAYVYDIEVREDSRGHGYGRAIMEAAERWASEHGASYLALNVFGGNRAARGLYESLGYAVISVEMRKALHKAAWP